MKSLLPNSVRSNRYLELDSLRGLAALTVFFSHAVNMLLLNGPVFDLFNKSVLHIFWDGTAAVVLFFVLSGFVLALPYIDSQKKFDYLPFITRRIFRIYPAYIAAIFISLGLKMLLFDKNGMVDFSAFINQFWKWDNTHLTVGSVIKHILMIGPKFEMGEIDPIIWSLIVEMKISVVFPILLFLVIKIRPLWGKIALCILPIIIYKLYVRHDFSFIPFVDGVLIAYTPMFILGIILAKYRNTLVKRVQQLPKLACGLLFVVGILLYTSRFSFPSIGLDDGVFNYLTALGVAIIIILSISRPLSTSILVRKPVKFLGEVSYSLYLLHFPILLTCTSLIYLKLHSIKLSILVSLVVSLCLSYLSYRWIEKPFQRWGSTLSKLIGNFFNGSTKNIPAIQQKISNHL